MVDIVGNLVNEDGLEYDVREDITASVADSTTNVFVEFVLNPSGVGDEDIFQYHTDSLHIRLKYEFNILGPVLPTVKLNTFSYTRKENSDTIPCVLYYRTDDMVAHIIDSLPVVFTNEITKEMEVRGFAIYAECEQSYKSTDKVYIHYDIEVGDKRYIVNSKFDTKWSFDWRPKFW
jgi:hypothetical protein